MKRSSSVLSAFLLLTQLAACSSTAAVPSAAATSSSTPTEMAQAAASMTPSAVDLQGVFVMEIDGDIWVMNGDGSRRLQLTSGAASDFDPHWSPDGKQIVFRTERGVRGTDIQSVGFDCLFIINADGSGERQLYPPDADTPGGLFPSWGSNNLIAFSSFSDSGQGESIYTIHPDGSGLVELGHPEGGAAEIARWSPDSTQMAFESHPGDGRWEIWIMYADGSGMKQLTFNTKIPGGDSGAHIGAWSPDGRRIAFSSDHEGNREVYVMNADGTNVQRLTQLPATQAPTVWFPDGRILVEDWRAGNRYPDWFLMNPDGTNMIPVPQLEGVNSPIDWRQ